MKTLYSFYFYSDLTVTTTKDMEQNRFFFFPLKINMYFSEPSAMPVNVSDFVFENVIFFIFLGNKRIYFPRITK